MCGESLVRIPFVDILGKFTAYPSISVCQSFLYDTTNYEMLFSGKQARKVISTLNQCLFSTDPTFCARWTLSLVKIV